MKAPEYVRINAGYWESKPIQDLKQGDKLELCFGDERSRLTNYIVTYTSKSPKGKLVSIGFKRIPA